MVVRTAFCYESVDVYKRQVSIHALPDKMFPNRPTGNGLRNSLVASDWGIMVITEDHGH